MFDPKVSYKGGCDGCAASSACGAMVPCLTLLLLLAAIQGGSAQFRQTRITIGEATEVRQVAQAAHNRRNLVYDGWKPVTSSAIAGQGVKIQTTFPNTLDGRR